MNQPRKPVSLPSGLGSKAGWGRYLELQRSPEPHLHQIEPTNACPFSCVMCTRPTRMKRPIGYMDFNLFRKVLDEVATFPSLVREREIELFHFGESLLHPRLPEMVAYTTSLGLRAVLSVNPPRLDATLGEALLRARPHRIICSMDADDPASYRRMRGPAADFERALVNLEALLETRRKLGSSVPIVVRMIQTKENRGTEDGFATRWRSAGAEVELRPFFPWNDPALAGIGDWERLPEHMPCPFPWRYLVIQWNGDVVPCCRDCNGDIVLGNAAENSLREIWNNEAYRAFRDEMIRGTFSNPICGPCMDLYSVPPGGSAAEGQQA